MKQIAILESPSFEVLINNLEDYLQEFKESGAVVYRGANFSEKQQLDLMRKLGDILGWSPNSQSKRADLYRENHGKGGASKEDRKTKDEIFLKWHMEHTEYKNPIVGATWNMNLFTCDPSIGRTGFVDTTKLYERLPEEWQNFLSNCVEIVQKYIPANDEYSEFIQKVYEIPCIKKHWLDGSPTVRVDLDGLDVFGIYFLDGKDVTEEDLLLFTDIKEFIFSEISYNSKNLLVHEWNQGDIVLVDLFRMAHAVFGGFYPEEREFSGYWAYRDEH